MIDETVKIHDIYQFEIKQSYNIFPGRDSSYFVSTYIFIPRNLNINRDTYSPADFYRDLHTYIRLRTPFVTLKEIADGGRPIRLVRESAERVMRRMDRSAAQELEYRIKMWSTVFRRSLQRETISMCTSIQGRDLINAADQYLGYIKRILESFRSAASPLFDHQDETVRLSVCYADEFAGMNAESYVLRILEKIQAGHDRSTRLEETLLAFAHDERKYRATRNYPSGSDPTRAGEDETYLYRQSVLKKYLSSGLFLETRLRREGLFIEQMLLSAAAGLAMVFATTVAFITQKKYGGLTFTVFVALVLSYMLKDRMKEFMKNYLSNSMKRWLYDRKRIIYHGFRHPMGYCKESVNYLEEKDVPPDVRKLRSRDPMANLDNSLVGETVILYRKYVSLNSSAFRKLPRDYPLEGITDILRFHIMDFLQTMDNPGKKIYTATSGGWTTFTGKRVYHLNMITRYQWGHNEVLRRFRIVLNREGIRRLEEVFPLADD